MSADLDLEVSDKFTARERLVHRGAVVVMLGIVAAGLLGVFGFGPLSVATREGADYRLRLSVFFYP
jgi:hypothetical protein